MKSYRKGLLSWHVELRGFLAAEWPKNELTAEELRREIRTRFGLDLSRVYVATLARRASGVKRRRGAKPLSHPCHARY